MNPTELVFTTTRENLEFLWNLLETCQFLGSEAEIVASVRSDLRNALTSAPNSTDFDAGHFDAGNFDAVRVMDTLRAQSGAR